MLIARVKSLARLKTLTDEIAACAPSTERSRSAIDRRDRAAWLDSRRAAAASCWSTTSERPAERIARGARRRAPVDVEPTRRGALLRARRRRVRPGDRQPRASTSFDGLRLCRQLRSLERTRHLPILVIVEPATTRACCEAWRSASTTISSRPVDAQRAARRACAPRFSASATPTTCATTSTRRWSWRSPTS